MLLDIQAIQRIYGANTRYHNTDNTYFLIDDGALRTMWDTGGNDWLDVSNLGYGML
jgi:serralysin